MRGEIIKYFEPKVCTADHEQEDLVAKKFINKLMRRLLTEPDGHCAIHSVEGKPKRYGTLRKHALKLSGASVFSKKLSKGSYREVKDRLSLAGQACLESALDTLD